MIKLALAGAAGRMGRTVLELLPQDGRFALVAALVAEEDPRVGEPVGPGSSLRYGTTWTGSCDVMLDFSLAAGTRHWLEVCVERRVPMVIGTSGHSEDDLRRVREAAESIPVVKAANFSPGLNVLLAMTGKVAELLGPEYDAEIVEAHHRHKIDAPSATAMALLEELLRARGGSVEANAAFGRKGQTGERPAGQIGVHAMRLGDTVGRHEVHFGGAGETLTISHAVHSRETFARGALRAAAWVIGRAPGLYGMGDVVAEV